MAEAVAHRIFIEDDRHQGAYLRTTWHPDRRVVVISHWDDDLCLAATRVPIGDVSALVSVLVTALGEVAQDRSEHVTASASGLAWSVSRRRPWLEKVEHSGRARLNSLRNVLRTK